MAGFSRARLGRISQVLGGYIERGEVAGAVGALSRNGEVLVETIGLSDLETGAPIGRDTVFRVASMTKPVTAVAAMILVEEARVRLDDPVDAWLPEVADRRVLRRPDGPIADTVPANRPITLRDLLTLRPGIGAVMTTIESPIQRAMGEAGLGIGGDPFPEGPDVYMARLAGLPLVHQPGQVWMYHIGIDILGVLIARVAGTSLGTFLQERIFTPLGMKDTGFSVPEAQIHRLATAYRREAGGLVVHDPARGGVWSRPPAFEAGGGGLASTADDFLAFGRMMLDHGRHPGGRILSRPTVELMTADQLTPEEKARSPFVPGFWDATGWGFGMGVSTRRTSVGASAGSFGWDGGFGTSWWCDPREDLVGMLLTQRVMGSPTDRDPNRDFETLAYQALDD